MCDFANFEEYIYLKKSHLPGLSQYSQELYGQDVPLENGSTKHCQDLIIMQFIKENIPPGSKILDIGGAHSRILRHFHPEYECWLVDAFEGLGGGTRSVPKVPYRVVVDYVGNFNPELPEGYFDFVFSISALEHSPWDEESCTKIINDIQRILKPGGISLHCIDSFILIDRLNIHPFINSAFKKAFAIGKPPDFDTIVNDTDVRYTSASDIQQWLEASKSDLTVEEFINTYGHPFTIQILWQKESAS